MWKKKKKPEVEPENDKMKKFLLALVFTVVIFHNASCLTRRDKLEELMQEISGEENETNKVGNFEEDADDILDEIYRENDPSWWSNKNKNKEGGKNHTSKTRRWSRLKQKAKTLLKGAHHAVTKAQEYAPHILKGVKYLATLLGKKKRELIVVERKRKHLERDIEELQDELVKKRK